MHADHFTKGYSCAFGSDGRVPRVPRMTSVLRMSSVPRILRFARGLLRAQHRLMIVRRCRTRGRRPIWEWSHLAMKTVVHRAHGLCALLHVGACTRARKFKGATGGSVENGDRRTSHKHRARWVIDRVFLRGRLRCASRTARPTTMSTTYRARSQQ